MTFASASAVTVTLILVGIFFVIMMNMNKFANDIENDVEVHVYIDLTANEQDQAALKKKIESIEKVESIRFSSKEQQLDSLIKSLGKDWRLYEQDNPLYDVFIVKTKNPTDTPVVAKQIKNYNHVNSAKYGEKKVDRLFHVLKVSRNAGLAIIIGLVFTAMFLISNTIKIAIFSRRKEIEIMKLVGATNWFIRWPFLMEGIWLGILGSILPITIIGFGYYYLFDFISSRVPDELLQPLSYNPFVFEVSGLILLIGVFIGGWGSMMSLRRYLKV